MAGSRVAAGFDVSGGEEGSNHLQGIGGGWRASSIWRASRRRNYHLDTKPVAYSSSPLLQIRWLLSSSSDRKTPSGLASRSSQPPGQRSPQRQGPHRQPTRSTPPWVPPGGRIIDAIRRARPQGQQGPRGAAIATRALQTAWWGRGQPCGGRGRRRPERPRCWRRRRRRSCRRARSGRRGTGSGASLVAERERRVVGDPNLDL